MVCVSGAGVWAVVELGVGGQEVGLWRSEEMRLFGGLGVLGFVDAGNDVFDFVLDSLGLESGLGVLVGWDLGRGRDVHIEILDLGVGVGVCVCVSAGLLSDLFKTLLEDFDFLVNLRDLLHFLFVLGFGLVGSGVGESRVWSCEDEMVVGAGGILVGVGDFSLLLV